MRPIIGVRLTLAYDLKSALFYYLRLGNCLSYKTSVFGYNQFNSKP